MVKRFGAQNQFSLSAILCQCHFGKTFPRSIDAKTQIGAKLCNLLALVTPHTQGLIKKTQWFKQTNTSPHTCTMTRGRNQARNHRNKRKTHILIRTHSLHMAQDRISFRRSLSTAASQLLLFSVRMPFRLPPSFCCSFSTETYRFLSSNVLLPGSILDSLKLQVHSTTFFTEVKGTSSPNGFVVPEILPDLPLLSSYTMCWFFQSPWLIC